jgi:hypothetical protein
MSLMNAVAPLVGVVIDPAALAKHVLQNGFGIKNPEAFMVSAPAPMLGPGAPTGDPSQPSTQPVSPVGPSAGMGGVPPEILTQLESQVGLSL